MSGGPYTAAGKAVAKMNATRHGLRANSPVLPTESAEEWETHRTGIVEAIVPVGALEQSLAERVALLLWRLQRVARFETQMASAAIAEAEEDYVKERETPSLLNARSFSRPPETLRREIRRLPAIARLLGELERLDAARRIAGPDANDILTECCSLVGHIDDAFDPEEINFPDLPNNLDWDEFPDITAGILRRCIDVIARAVDEDHAALVAATRAYCAGRLRTAKAQLAEAEAAISHSREQRALPSRDFLDKIQRYETHLHRQLLQTLHELEAIQGRRAGRPSPLARLDVSGVDLSK